MIANWKREAYCCGRDCSEKAVATPMLVIITSQGTFKARAAMPFCERHRAELKLEDLLDDKLWAMITKPVPKDIYPIRKLTRLEWNWIDPQHTSESGGNA